MAFNPTEWAAQVKARLQAWAQTPHAWRDAGAQTLFGFLATMTLFPLVEALGRGDSMGVGMALGSVAAGVGGDLVAEMVRRWSDRADKTQRGEGAEAPAWEGLAADLEAALTSSQELRQAVDALLAELDVVRQAQQALPETEQRWLVEQLQNELDDYPVGLKRTTVAVDDIYRKIVQQGGITGALGGRGHQIVQHIYQDQLTSKRFSGENQSASKIDNDKTGMMTPTNVGWSERDKEAERFFCEVWGEGNISEDSLLRTLHEWGLVTTPQGGYLTMAGALLFGPLDRMPRGFHTDVQMEQVEERDKLWNYNGYCLMNLYRELLDRLLQLTQDSWEDPSKRDSFGRPIKVSKYPQTAIIEALANFIIHRDYTIDDLAYITIRDNCVEFTNPGTSSYSAEELLNAKEPLHPKYSRNNIVIRCFSRMGLNQRQGRGIIRIRESLLENGNVRQDGSAALDIENDLPVERFRLRIHAFQTPAMDPRHAFHTYLSYVIGHTQHLHLQGIRSTGDLASIDLEEVYITLDAVQKRTLKPDEMEAELARLGGRVPGDETWRAEIRQGREVEVVLSVNEALAGHSRLVVLGAPGSGKTTFLHYLALTYARDLRGDHVGLVRERLGLADEGERRLPVLLPLRNFAQHLSATKEDARLDGPRFLLDYLSDYFTAQEVALPGDFFRRVLEAGGAAVLLDGLDEVADPDLRRRVARIVEAFTRRYPKNRYLVTSRLVGYQGAARLGEDYFCATVRDFGRAAVAQFVSNWSLAVEVALAGRRSPTVERRAVEQTKGLLAAIQSNERVRELAVNPLLLTVIALVHRYRAKLPERRAELYEECIEVLLGYWDEARGVKGYALPGLALDAGDKRSLLEPVAFWMHERTLREIDREMLLEQLCDLFLPLSGDDRRLAGKRAEAFVGLIGARSGLLQERGLGVYSFSHLTFQEYLAARALAGRKDFVAYALGKAGEGWWREALLVAAGYLSTQGKERVTAYVGALMAHSEEPEPYHNLVLAAEALRDVGPARVEGDLWGEVTGRLLHDMADEQAPVARRVAAGEALGQAGDPRFSGPYLEPELVRVPAGEFWMGGKESWEGGRIDRIYVAGFQMARYPVTNAQYKVFVDAGGYDEQRYWTAAGWAWRQGQGEQYGRKHREWPEGWQDGQYPAECANHPVVGVTWYEAVAYCHWLAEATGKPYRLPGEAEWEKAARGGEDKRVYPWGDEFDAAKANLGLGDEKVGGTTPVGIYPGGASPYGVLDASGNVWEWCGSLRWDYPHQPDDGREEPEAEGYRVLRGGSWLADNERNARCTYRFAARPAYFYDSYGLRVMVGFSDRLPHS